MYPAYRLYRDLVGLSALTKERVQKCSLSLVELLNSFILIFLVSLFDVYIKKKKHIKAVMNMFIDSFITDRAITVDKPITIIITTVTEMIKYIIYTFFPRNACSTSLPTNPDTYRLTKIPYCNSKVAKRLVL